MKPQHTEVPMDLKQAQLKVLIHLLVRHKQQGAVGPYDSSDDDASQWASAVGSGDGTGGERGEREVELVKRVELQEVLLVEEVVGSVQPGRLACEGEEVQSEGDEGDDLHNHSPPDHVIAEEVAEEASFDEVIKMMG